MSAMPPTIDRTLRTPTRLDGALFQPLGDGSRPALVEARLSDAISSGVLHAGERLPSEHELAQSFGVSPASVREALNSLRARGLIVTRRGRGGGSFVDESVDPVAFAQRSLAEISITALRDMALHYFTILAGSMRMAARRGAEEEFEYLAQRLSRVNPDSTENWRGAIDEFLTELAALSQSPRLTHELMLRHLEFAPFLRLLDTDDDARQSHLAHLERLLAKVDSGDGSAAADECEVGVRDLLDRLIRMRSLVAASTDG